MATEISGLQREILEFAKAEDFHGTLEDFHKRNPEHTKEELEEALKGLKRSRLVSMPPALYTGWIGVTNTGWKVMGWQ